MAFKVKAVHSVFPEGTEISFGNYFLAKVGEEVIVTDEVIEKYKNDTGNDLKDSLPQDWKATHATKAEVAEVIPPEEETTTPTNDDEGGETK